MNKQKILMPSSHAKGNKEMIRCPNCGEQGPHFVPPSIGEKGFFICKTILPKGQTFIKRRKYIC